ncbi:hypothetical protein, partial [Vibrio anguillarum]|uniref:hypothetical protein n=1 Tax=Vibrio anguillarum TaxID=55601 RepID=UPI001BE43113
ITNCPIGEIYFQSHLIQTLAANFSQACLLLRPFSDKANHNKRNELFAGKGFQTMKTWVLLLKLS